MTSNEREPQRLLVSGGCGFIGANFVRRWLGSHTGTVLNIDALTYAGDPRRLEGVDGRHEHARIDVADRDAVRAAVSAFEPDAVVHFAALSSVTRSESEADESFRVNVEGTRSLLDVLTQAPPSIVVHISTDEVYGPCLGRPPFREDEKEPGEGLATSPYARSKAIADDLARGYTDRLPVIVARPTNCFGPWQDPEKAFPRWTIRALKGQKLPLWGDGQYVRDWLPVEDASDAIEILLLRGEAGGVYNIGPAREPEITNAALVRWLLGYLGASEEKLVFTEYDRPDHDRRYAIDADRIRALGWSPSPDVWTRFAATVDWYAANETWWLPRLEEAEAIHADRAEVDA